MELLPRYNGRMDHPADRQKKILFLITKTGWGGAQQYVYDVATNLPREGFEAVVAGGGDGALFAKLRTAGIRTVSIPGLQRDVGMMSEWRALREIVRLLKKERPDVVHLNSSKAAGIGALAAFIHKALNPKPYPLNARIIFTVHGWGFYEDRPAWQRAVIFLASWMTCLLCDRAVVLSKKEQAAAWRFLLERKVVLIPHGLARIDFYGRTEARAFFSTRIGRLIPDDTLLIGTIAELTRNKDISSFVSAAHLLKSHFNNFLFLIIGDGEERVALERQIADAYLKNSVFLAGFVPDASRFLLGLDIFVLPSVKEGLPYALMSAMAAGLPVVATRVGGIPDLITDGEDGIIAEPKDAKGLAALLARLAASPGERQRIGSRARQKIETRFPFDAMMKRTISLYSEPLNASAPLE